MENSATTILKPNTSPVTTFGRVFKNLRVRRGLNRVDLHRGSGVARTTIVVYEGLPRFSGQPEKLRALLAFLHSVSPLTRSEAQQIADLVEDPAEVLPEPAEDNTQALATRLSVMVGEAAATGLLRAAIAAVEQSRRPANTPILPLRHPDVETPEGRYEVRVYTPPARGEDNPPPPQTRRHG